MKCAYCLEEMNEGASVCKTCGREQPPSEEQKTEKRNFWIALGLGLAIGIPLLGAMAWSVYDGSIRKAEVNRIVQCARFNGYRDIKADYIDFEFDQMSQGRGWRTGAAVVALQHGCTPHFLDN